MTQLRNRNLAIHVGLWVLLLLFAAIFIWFGFYNFAADVKHSRPVFSLIETARERSVQVRAAKIGVPPLEDRAAIVKGAGNYQAMCAQCHLAPGMGPTELSRGLYPSPPPLAKRDVDPAVAFWTIKHGIKASGMPAWGTSMGDQDVWNLVAFVKKLPRMEVIAYRELVQSSSGHSHAGSGAASLGNTRHSVEEDMHGEHDEADPKPSPATEPSHTHKDGEQH